MSPATTGTAPRPTCRRAPSRGTTSRARRPTGVGDPASTARSISIATISRTPAGRPTSSSTIPADLPSGIYAAWLQADDDEDYLPFTVRPPRGTPRSRIAVLMSTVTYVTYANFTDIGRDAWQEGAYRGNAMAQPYADPSLSRDAYGYVAEHSLYGTYDVHEDGSGVCYGSMLRPILNMRPKFRYRTLGAPARFPADLYQVDWLEQKGIEVDYLTDHDLVAEGVDLLRPYTVVVSSSHHEYWTSGMLDALAAYLDGGGRFMYMGGNGLFGVVSVDPDRPHLVEVRRWGTGWPYEMPPAERHHSMTGEQGGTWRNRGRGPHALVGLGTAGAGFDRGSPYQRQPDSDDPRAAFIFEGIEERPDRRRTEPAGALGRGRLRVRPGRHRARLARIARSASPRRCGSTRRTRRWSTTRCTSPRVATAPMSAIRRSPARRIGSPGPTWRTWSTRTAAPSSRPVRSAGAAACRRTTTSGTVSRVTENVLRQFADPDWRRPEA